MKAKKQKRQGDFQKVQLKVGKKKPKADNATNVNFRSKAIHLPEQLKHVDSGPTKHRQLDIMDLLSKLHHINSNIKQGALVGLRELLSAQPSMIELHASAVLSEVAALFTDKDGSVRAAAVRLLRFITQCIPAERVVPFFPLLSAHLTCAMTHISEAIQEDALRVLDVLLEHYPGLLSQRHTVLLTNFLELISQKRKAATGQDKSGKGGFALTISTNRSVTAQQWRLTVLLRLGSFLQAVVEERPLDEGVTSSIGLGMWAGEKGSVTSVDVSWEEHVFGKGRIQVFENSGAVPTPHSAYRLRPDSKAGAGMNKELCSAETVQGFAGTLVPLLLEIWVEAAGGDHVQTDSGHLLSAEAMALMFQILTILQLLRRVSPHRDQKDILDAWFRNSYLADFKHHFMKNFPYGLLEVARHKKKADGKRIRQQVAAGTVAGGNVEPLALNVTLCQVMVTLSLRGQDHVEAEDADWLGTIRVFIRETLSNGGKLSSKHLAALLEVVWRMIVTQRSRVVTDDLLQAVYVQYQQRNLAVSVRSLLLCFFSQFYIQEHQNHPHIARSRILARWLASLPVQLVQLGSRNPQLSAQLLETIHPAAARGNKDLLQSLQKNACSIYDPQEGCVVVLPVESQKRLVQILHSLPAFPAELLACLSQVCNTGRVSASLATMLIRTIHLRSPLCGWSSSSQDVPVKDVDYLSFFFTTLTGFSSEMLQALQDTDEDSLLPSSILSPLSVFATTLEQFLHHWDIVEEVCHCLDTLGSRAQCFDVIQNAIIKNLCGLVVVPDCVCAAILRCVPRLLDVNFLPSDTLLHFLSDCCLSMLNLLLQLEQSAHKRDAVWEACFAALSTVPRLLRLVLQSFRVCDLCEEELPVLAQILSLLLQHTQLRNHMMANASLLQHIIQDLTHFYGGETREQWLTDLLYCYSVTLFGHRANMGMRDIY
ncbi:testis-expressed sequence 10 protein homolog [Sinocyclocheilus rhinocerous]|uniref:Testis-expressed sequence 10 protein homolog n=1 Tax=Sinocyclocheilus rhinocerous TaxID=307959 RepID=A0A673JNR0_9TELE|nr:PREDICTED: testis-expressed sequence 10 protein homolog [Sinocyclocheilus rhinocerous]XP_016387575.1 PREDICTED: testis-expressed sequence 10 protein homolog [Sinocyclocheilus rhinocerous]XP_016387576.1 PREDICTED: testis-expressed sequence 10 protein homolog [Sinocyclocheilus rhinocerous]